MCPGILFGLESPEEWPSEGRRLLGPELVAASMCLSLAEVGNDPRRKTDIKGSLANDFSIAVFAANLQRRMDGAS
jgi:hypothetical protein